MDARAMRAAETETLDLVQEFAVSDDSQKVIENEQTLMSDTQQFKAGTGDLSLCLTQEHQEPLEHHASAPGASHIAADDLMPFRGARRVVVVEALRVRRAMLAQEQAEEDAGRGAAEPNAADLEEMVHFLQVEASGLGSTLAADYEAIELVGGGGSGEARPHGREGGLQDLLDRALKVAGVGGAARGNVVGGGAYVSGGTEPSRVEQQQRGALAEVQRLHDRAHAAFNVILENQDDM